MRNPHSVFWMFCGCRRLCRLGACCTKLDASRLLYCLLFCCLVVVFTKISRCCVCVTTCLLCQCCFCFVGWLSVVDQNFIEVIEIVCDDDVRAGSPRCIVDSWRSVSRWGCGWLERGGGGGVAQRCFFKTCLSGSSFFLFFSLCMFMCS